MQRLSADSRAIVESELPDRRQPAIALPNQLILQEQKVVPSDGMTDSYFDEVYVFSRSNNSWNQTQILIADDSAAFDEFGASLALDRVTALVGAPNGTANGHAAQGAAYVLAISGGMLTQTQKITSRDGASNDEFGWRVAITESVAGHRALIGAPMPKLDATLSRTRPTCFTKWMVTGSRPARS
jgi:hypothetical protein